VKKDVTKVSDTKAQKSESIEIEMDKKEKPKLKPSIKPIKVFISFAVPCKKNNFHIALFISCFVSTE